MEVQDKMCSSTGYINELKLILCVENASGKLVEAREFILIWPLSHMEASYFMKRHTLHVPLLFL